MTDPIPLDMICMPSKDIVARQIEGELIIVPLTADLVDMEDALYTLNGTGRAIWAKLDGVRSLRQIVRELSEEYQAPAADIERGVIGLVGELLHFRIVTELEPKKD